MAVQALQRQLTDLGAQKGKVTKDLSAVSLIPAFSGASNIDTAYEFIDVVNGAGKMGVWSDEDKIYAAKMKLTGVAKTGNSELREDSLKWKRFTDIFK
jgi:hypothetical protein